MSARFRDERMRPFAWPRPSIMEVADFRSTGVMAARLGRSFNSLRAISYNIDEQQVRVDGAQVKKLLEMMDRLVACL